jgi:hypothetical protein
MCTNSSVRGFDRMAVKKSGNEVLYLAASAFLVMLQACAFMDYGVIFPSVVALAAISVILLLVQFLSFGRERSRLLRPEIITIVIIALTTLQVAALVSKGYVASASYTLLQNIMMYFVLSIASIAPLFIGVMMLRRFKKKGLRLLGVLLIGFSAFSVLLFLLSGAFSGVALNDAAWSVYHGDRLLFSGLNPYAHNTSGLYSAFQNGTIDSVSINTDNRLGGSTPYPILYLLLSAPFVAVSSSLGQFSPELLAEEAVFYLLFIAVIAYFGRWTGRKDLVALIVVMPFLFFGLISFVDMVMIAAILVAFFRPKSWYFGVALGIAASIQQLAWIPVIMLLIYSITRPRANRALRDIAAFGATLAIVNGYYLLSGPYVYLGRMLGQLGNVLPTGLSPFGALLIRYYNIPLSYFHWLFYLALGASVVLFLALGKRRNFAILSLVPFLFLDFGRIEYYVAFIIIGIVALVLGDPLKVELPVISRRTTYIALSLIAAAILLVIVYGHMLYSRSFTISVYDQSASPNSGNLIYSGALRTGNFSGYLRVLLYSFYGNTSITKLLIANNTVTLGRAGAYEAYNFSGGPGIPDNKVYISNPGPTSILVGSYNNIGGYAECAIYNATYFYLCPSAGIGQNR